MAKQNQKVTWPVSFVIVLAVLLISVSGYLIYIVGRVFIKSFSGSSSDVKAAIIAGVFTVLVTVFSAIVTRYFERKKEIEQEHRKQKGPIYGKFIDFIFDLFNSEKLGKKKKSEQEMMEFLQGFFKEIVIWGSNDVIKAYNKSKKTELTNKERAFAFEELLIAMRRDLGHGSTLKKGELLAIFISDIDKYLP